MKKLVFNHYFLIFLLFIFSTLIFYYPIFQGKVPFNGHLLVSFWFPWKFNFNLPFKFMGVDEIREFYPLFDFNYKSLRSGNLPFWNPYTFSGSPHLANWGAAVFYPLNLFIFLLGKIPFYLFLDLIAPVLTGFFTYLYLNALSLKKRASFLGALIFAFSSVMLIWQSEFWQSAHSFLWLPLVLWAMEKFLKSKKAIFILVGAFGLAASVLAGYVQTTFYLYLLVFTYLIFRKSWRFIWAFILSIGFSAIHWLPAFEFYWLSSRREMINPAHGLSFLLPLKQMVTLFIPDFFGHIATQNWFAQRPGQYYESMIYFGVVPLLLIPLAFLLKKYQGHLWFFFIWLTASLSLVFDLPTSRLIYHWRIFFLSSAIPIRIIFLTAFSASILAALGANWWLSGQKKVKKTLLFLFPLILIYGSIGIGIICLYLSKIQVNGFPENWFIISLRNSVIPGIVFTAAFLILIFGSLKPAFKRFLFLGLVFLVFSHSFIFFHKYLDFNQLKYFYPSHPLLGYLRKNLGVNRFWGYFPGKLDSNFSTVYQIASPEGYDPVNLKHYSQLLSAVDKGEYKGVISRYDAFTSSPEISPLEDKNPYRLKMLDLLGVKLITFYSEKPDKKKFENERFKLVWQQPPFYIFKNKKVLPRAFLVSKAILAGSEKEAIDLVLSEKIDLSKEVILQEKVKEIKKKKDDYRQAQIISYLPNQVVVKTRSATDQFLVLTDPYYPAWKARIDNQLTKIYPADHVFRSVLVPAGEHKVVFEYDSGTFKLGLGMTLLSFLLTSGWLKKKKKGKSSEK